MTGFIRARWGLIAGLMVLTLFYGCWYYLPFRSETYTWHNLIQAEVSTPQGPVTSSVVRRIQVKYYPNGLFATGTETERKLTGEALVVDLGAALGPRRYLFGLIAGTSYEALDTKEIGLTKQEIFQHNVEQVDGKPREIRLALWVGFADVNDPDSIFFVDSANLAASYGEGYSIAKQTLQTTDAPVTAGQVRDVLSWLKSHESELKLALPDGRVRSIYRSMFDTEISK